MGLKKFLVGALVMGVAGVGVATGPVDAAATATLTGRFSSTVGKALVITTNGTTYTATPGANGAFSVKMPASRVKNATVQMVDPTGKYLGPVVLGVTKVKTKYKAITGLKAVAKGTVSLGTVAMKSGYAISGSKKAGGTQGVRASSKAGAPKGAGNGGRVKSGGFAPVAIASIVHKFAATTCPDGSTRDTGISGTGAGQDLDCDGVPNAIDVDDNGNGSLDILDQSTNDSNNKANYTASMSTYSEINANMSAKLNIHASDAATLLASIKDILGSEAGSSTGSFNIAVYLGEWTFSRQTGSTPDGVYIECSGIKWCDPTLPTASAKLQTFTEISTILGWNSTKWAETGPTDLSSGKAVADATYKSNGMYKFKDSSGQGRFAAFVSPSYKGDDVLSVVRPADVLQLHAISGGVDTVFTINISPFFLTTPYISAVTAAGVTTNTAANLAAGDVAIGSDGKLGLSFYRPQRLLLEGETGEATNSMFKSQHGLHYGIGFNQYYINGQMGRAPAELGCGGADAGSNYGTLSANMKAETSAYGEDELASDFWPVLDGTDDTSTNDDAMSFTWDMKNCFTNHTPAYFGKREMSSYAGKKIADATGFSWDKFAADPTAFLQASLVAVGSPSTNGYNRATLSFKIHSPAWTGQSNNGGNNSSGSNNSGGNNSSGGGSGAVIPLSINKAAGTFSVTGLSNTSGNCGTDNQCSGTVTSGSSIEFTTTEAGKTIDIDPNQSTPNVRSACSGYQTQKMTCTIKEEYGNPQTWYVKVQ